MLGYLYILECSDGSFYTGSTIDLERRVEQHQNGEGANHTKKRLPVKLVYFEEFNRIDMAFYREKQIQGWNRAKKEALINSKPELLNNLAECKNKSYCSNAAFDSAQAANYPSAQAANYPSAQAASERSLSGAEMNATETNAAFDSAQAAERTMQRYIIQLSYNGTSYHGWQVQANASETIQEVLNEMLSRLLNEPISVVGCGRTDAGVHAKEYFAHFDSTLMDLTENQSHWIFKFNYALPSDIAIQKIFSVNEKAHSRYDAISRTYQYYITKKKNPFRIDKACFLYGALDVPEMNKAATVLFEYTDFSAFAKRNTQNATNNCTIYKAEWKEEGDMLVFTISANRFLRNMVRAVVGTLLKVGKGKLTIEGFKEVIESKTRSKAGLSAHACGLYLVNVEYPQNYFNE